MSASDDGWIDISVPLRTGMPHWPNNTPVVLERTKDMAAGATSNNSRLALGVHSGTHVDAPLHFRANGAGVEQLPLDALVGRARVVEISHETEVTVAELETAGITRGARVLLKTRNSPRAWQASEFVEDAVHISIDAAAWLAARGIKTLGIDYLSVGGYRAKNGHAVHHALLDAGIVIIEGLDLTNAPVGDVELCCLPLRLVDCDGAPARAIVRPVSGPRP